MHEWKCCLLIVCVVSIRKRKGQKEAPAAVKKSKVDTAKQQILRVSVADNVCSPYM